MGSVNHSELAAFLKSRRARIRPSDVGLPTGPRRRVPGLRREEVSQLAGLSADYYTELERGRGAQPSAQVLAALARALRLNGDERDHLFHLADRMTPPAAHGPTAHVQPGLLGLLDQLTTTPAQVITDLHQTLVQNPLAAALVGRPPAVRGPAASFVYRWFTDPDARTLYPAEDHPHHSRVFVADLQAVAARRGDDTEVHRMVAALRRRSEEFTTLWDTHDVALRRADHKRRARHAGRHGAGLPQPVQRGRTPAPAVVQCPTGHRRRRPAGTSLRHRHPGHDSQRDRPRTVTSLSRVRNRLGSHGACA